MNTEGVNAVREEDEVISKEKFATAKGVPEHTVNNWMQRAWTKGYHYQVVGRTTMIHRKRVEAWLTSHFRADSTELLAEKSESRLAEARESRRTARRSTSRQTINSTLQQRLS